MVESFHTAKSGFAHVEKHPCDLVIAAQILPDMDGIQFLSKMRQLLPDAARILISNAPEKTLLSQAINEAEVQACFSSSGSTMNFVPMHAARHGIFTRLRLPQSRHWLIASCYLEILALQLKARFQGE